MSHRIPHLSRYTGLFWHIHHRSLFEHSLEIKTRQKHLLTKPNNEVPIRLKRLRPIKGVLGNPKIYAAYMKACLHFEKIRNELTEAAAKRDQIIHENYRTAALRAEKKTKKRAKSVPSLTRFYNTESTARRATTDLWEKLRYTISHEEAETLHKKECKKCPWNGQTLFPKTKIT